MLVVTNKDGIPCLRKENPFGTTNLENCHPCVQNSDARTPCTCAKWEQFELDVRLIPITFTAEDGTRFSEDEVELVWINKMGGERRKKPPLLTKEFWFQAYTLN